MMSQLGTIMSLEDNDTDFMTLEFALRAAGVKNPVERCEDGTTAMRTLLGGESLALSASLILLDLNLPGVDGLQFLKAFRARDPNRTIPLLVLSTSSHPRDIDACYLAGADGYLVKPFELHDWEANVGSVAERWLAGRPATERGTDDAKIPAAKAKRAKPTAAMRAKYDRDMRRAQLTRTIEGEIIPRLLLAHGSVSMGAPKPTSELAKIVENGDEVAELAHLVLRQDVVIAASYVETMRMQGATLETVFQALIVPTARLIGDLWKADLCSFSEFSEALSHLHHMLAELKPVCDNSTMH